ncbi:hypothetical protein MG290_06020 [Flavobacterium sp. CBA20B-1]|uniref:hypothetical protein n=1 Tax=unclassified Flavobacterium TaxID=196869 RepID=UPI0022241606|nr:MULTISPECIES: hypothetical protein [unclassified Flavobacterium]WCM43212.1 hypothetical protein MG290_06020 [Flavobacterium sp. CBA20B-1]
MKKLILILLGLFAILGCNSSNEDDHNIKVYFDQETYNQQKLMWKQQNVQNYKFTIESMSSSEGPIEEEITVLNGEVVYDEDRSYNLTIDDIYDQIKSMYDYDVEQSKKDPLDPFYKIIDAIYHSVKYDKKYPIPISFGRTYDFNTHEIPVGFGKTTEIKNFIILD